MPLATVSFADMKWALLSLEARLGLFYDTLVGLRSLYQNGFMHCDISPKHLLIMFLEPCAATTCGYGKAVQEPMSTYTTRAEK